MKQGLTLNDFIRSEYFEYWDSDNRSPGSCGIILSDPERFDRMEEAAKNGSEGSTHREIIQDWQDCLDTLLNQNQITEADYNHIQDEINACYNWHEKNGSLDEEIG